MKAVFLVTNSPTCVQIWKSLESAGHEVVRVFIIDGIDEARLVEDVRAIAPNFAAFVGHAIERSLDLPILRRIAAIAPFIHLCCDGSDMAWTPRLKEYSDIFHLQVNMDGSSPDIPNCMTTLELMDERDFTPLPWYERDIRFGMSGGLGHGRRAEAITAAQQLYGLQLFRGTAPYGEAARLMCRIKVMFDHGMRPSGIGDQCKCRVIEAGYAGSALFENVETPLDRWLTPGVEYFPYGSVEDIGKLLKLPDDVLQESARRLNTRIHRDYAPRPAWERILKQAGLIK